MDKHTYALVQALNATARRRREAAKAERILADRLDVWACTRPDVSGARGHAKATEAGARSLLAPLGLLEI